MLLAWLITGCGVSASMRSIAHRPVGNAIQTIAVVEFANLSSHQRVGKLFSDLFLTELNGVPGLEVVDLSGLEESRAITIDRSRAEELGQHVHVDAVLTGVVIAFEYGRAPGSREARMPSILASVRLVASSDGRLLWAGRIDGTRMTLLSADSMPLDELAQAVVEDLAEEITDAMF